MNQLPRGPLLVQRCLFGVFGLVFFGVGLTTLVFLWSSSGPEEPPLFFRLIGSFIALAFVAFGGTMAYSVLRYGGMMSNHAASLLQAVQASRFNSPPAEGKGNYACSGCGASLAENADVSPLGDVKCAHCGRWFNVHKAS